MRASRRKSHSWLIGLSLLIISCTCLGLGAFIYNGTNNNYVSTEAGSKDVGVAEYSEESNADKGYTEITTNKRVTPSQLEISNPTSNSDKHYFYTTLNWEKKSDASVTVDGESLSDDIGDYFDMYDRRDAIGDASPSLTIDNIDSEIKFENHLRTGNSLTSQIYYSQSKNDVVDQNNVPSDDECKNDLNRCSYVCGPKGTGWSGEIVDNLTTTAFPSYIKVYCTRQTNGTYSQNYRLHFFYNRITSDGSDKLTRIDNGMTTTQSTAAIPVYITGTTTVASDATVSITCTESNISTVASTNSYFTWQVTIADTSYSAVNTYLNPIGTPTGTYSTNAGYDLRYQVIDTHRDRTSVSPSTIVPDSDGGSGVVDFNDSYCKTFIKNYLENVTGGNFNSSSYDVEIVSEDEVDGKFAHNFYTGKDGETDTDHPYLKVYAARLLRKKDSCYGYYRFFIFYYEKGSNELRCLHNTSNYFTSWDSGTAWPSFRMYPVNAYPNSNGALSSTDDSYSVIYYSFALQASYIRWYAELNGTTATTTARLEAPFYLNVDTDITGDDFDTDALKQYTIDQRGSDTDTVAIDDTETDENGDLYIDNPFPFLKIIQTRRKYDDGYYYFCLDIYGFEFGAAYQMTRIKQAGAYVDNTSSTDGKTEWLHIKINDLDATSNPSLGLDKFNYFNTASTLKYTYTYTDASGASATSDVVSLSLLSVNGVTLYPSDYQSNTYDSSLPETTLEMRKAAYNRVSQLSIYENVDTTRPYYLGGYFDTYSTYGTCFYSKAYYFRPSLATLTTLSTAYGYSTTFTLASLSYQQTDYNASTAPYLTIDSDRISGYTYQGATLFNWSSNYYRQRIVHTFANSDGDSLNFTHTIGAGITKGYFTNLIHSTVSPAYFSLSYRVRLVPKSEEIKEKMDEIIASYDFSFDVGVKSIDEYARM